jgi:hypothetical protein
MFVPAMFRISACTKMMAKEKHWEETLGSFSKEVLTYRMGCESAPQSVSVELVTAVGSKGIWHLTDND